MDKEVIVETLGNILIAIVVIALVIRLAVWLAYMMGIF